MFTCLYVPPAKKLHLLRKMLVQDGNVERDVMGVFGRGGFTPSRKEKGRWRDFRGGPLFISAHSSNPLFPPCLGRRRRRRARREADWAVNIFYLLLHACCPSVRPSTGRTCEGEREPLLPPPPRKRSQG